MIRDPVLAVNQNPSTSAARKNTTNIGWMTGILRRDAWLPIMAHRRDRSSQVFIYLQLRWAFACAARWWALEPATTGCLGLEIKSAALSILAAVQRFMWHT